MKKNSYHIANKNIRRFNTTWKFQYDVNVIKKDTIRFNTLVGEDGEKRTWYFNAPGGIVPGTVSYTYANGDTGLTHETFYDIRRTPDPDAPQFEYDADGEAAWDAVHPENITRYLRPDGADLYPVTAVGTVENVVIDTEAPKIAEDRSQYIVLGNSKRKFRYIFHEETALDFKNFSIKLGDKYIYQYVRKTDQITWDDTILLNVCVKADGLRTYLLEFTIDSEVVDAAMLNELGITIEVYDVAGNNSIYVVEREFVDLDPGDLKPVEINFYDPDPTDRVIEFGNEGEVWVDLYNPNKILWKYFPIAFKLNDLSLGKVDDNTIDDSTYEDDGHVKFKVKQITSRGKVIVDAWVEVDDEEWQKTVKSVTYNEAEDGPWIYMDERNRLYDFNPYVPSVLKNTDFGNFIMFVEKFLNTYYTGLSGETNISALEKTARILDFNDIHQVEKEYLYKYANELGNELDLTFQDIMDLDANLINRTNGFESNSYEDAVDVYRYIISNLPYYNQLKGSIKGVQMMLRMIGLCITVTNLWLKVDDDIEENPTFFDESQIFEMSEYFMSSYFTTSIIAEVDFRTFNDNISILINILKSIKPITRALESIKYTVFMRDEEHLVSNFNQHNDIDNMIEYACSYTGKESKYFDKYGNAIDSIMLRSAIYIPFDCDDCVITKIAGSDSVPATSMSNLYGILSKLATKNARDFVIHTSDGSTCTIPYGSFNLRRCDTGIIVENIGGEYGSKLYGMYKTMVESSGKFTIKVHYLKGTDNIFTV